MLCTVCEGMQNIFAGFRHDGHDVRVCPACWGSGVDEHRGQKPGIIMHVVSTGKMRKAYERAGLSVPEKYLAQSGRHERAMANKKVVG